MGVNGSVDGLTGTLLDKTKVIPYLSLTPVFAMLTGWLIVGETPTTLGIHFAFRMPLRTRGAVRRVHQTRSSHSQCLHRQIHFPLSLR